MHRLSFTEVFFLCSVLFIVLLMLVVLVYKRCIRPAIKRSRVIEKWRLWTLELIQIENTQGNPDAIKNRKEMGEDMQKYQFNTSDLNIRSIRGTRELDQAVYRSAKRNTAILESLCAGLPGQPEILAERKREVDEFYANNLEVKDEHQRNEEIVRIPVASF